jgi:pyruvate dehydrogenase E1 component
MGTMLFYREERSGQILEEGISEAGAISSWIAAATSYSVSDLPMLPFYIYYSMFGWQRVGDLIWAAADQRARGFLLGATAGRTTLSGEGLQHQDGGSHVGLATVPNCRAYDPAFAHEVAVLFEHGITEMIGEQQDVFYYLTVGNENYPQPSMPTGAREGIVRGMYLLGSADDIGGPWSPTETRQRVQSIATAAMPRGKTREMARAGAELQLLGSGAILIQVLQAAELLACFGVRASVWSVTSWSELQRDGIAAERDARIDPAAARPAYVTAQLADSTGPIIAATDYVRALPELIRAFVPRRYVTLGTDGFGRSATRPALRAFFEVDAVEIMLTALATLVDEGQFNAAVLRKLRLGLARAQSTQAPWQR